MAITTAARMERHVCDRSHVDPDRRESSTRSNAVGEPLVERSALCFRTRFDNERDATRRDSL